MKKFKIALLFLILAALFVVVYQNWTFFSAKQILAVDLKMKTFQTPDIATGLYFLGSFLIGFLLAYTAGLMARFKTKKAAKELNAVIDSQQEKISTLRGEMDLLKRRPVAQETTPVEEAMIPGETEAAPQQG
ncbi:LapA family protein [Desulfoluna sp.]|uniref:LapA family protein n=1 Tax=Desulfoluna sp. TaxID=2045199 RepID=UPI0026086C8E|nr:LapA family protein [Desulfoluna sp.]